jgi:hypothetical protein
VNFLSRHREAQLAELGIRAADLEGIALHWTSKREILLEGVDRPGVTSWITRMSADLNLRRAHFIGTGSTELESVAEALTLLARARLVESP